MSESKPDVSVVVITRNRERRLADLLSSLRSQTLERSRFEVVVVDDCSDEPTHEVLEAERQRGEIELRVVGRDRRGGPAAARNDGWRAANAPIVAYIDDDCVATPAWLAAGVEASRKHPGTVLSGRTDPMPWEFDRRRLPFARTIWVHQAGPYYETCNIFYPRALIERLGGFDEEAFPPGAAGEDTDLAWRAIAAGARTGFVDRAQVFHAFNWLGLVGKLRLAASWTPTIQVFARHPELHRKLGFGVFWKASHYLLLRTIVGLLLPRRLWPLRGWLWGTYVVYLVRRGREEGGGLLLAPYTVLHDLVEVGATVRGALRYRTLVL